MVRAKSLLSVWAVLLVFPVGFAGCAPRVSSSVKGTEYCFVPVGSQTYPSRFWAVGERVPVIHHIPKGYRTIGHFRAYGADSSTFLEEAMDYNAKRVGADLIVIQNLTRRPDKYFVREYVSEKKETVTPTKADWDSYRERCKEFDANKKRGVFSFRPESPKTSEQVISTKVVPEHWAIRSERVSVEALFLRSQ